MPIVFLHGSAIPNEARDPVESRFSSLDPGRKAAVIGIKRTRAWLTSAEKQKARSWEPGFLLEFDGVADGARTHDNRNHNPMRIFNEIKWLP
ncbi:MAG: hypothetical protein H7Z39_16470 [Burkholderiaceae bacterium]|nr:hypothetical protein [Burkholderiaceae bacterium]